MKRLGRYKILGELGRGAMGTVYRALDPKIDRTVALKTVTLTGPSTSEAKEYRQRFFREAQAAGRLTHPGIVTIYDVGENERTRTPFIVMEYVEGKTLEELGRRKRLPAATALDLVQQIAEALQYAHRQGIVHRDIKTANILVTPEGRTKITDFGIAKLASAQFTQPGQVLGTPAFMSPEQVSGDEVDGRSDIFSLGVILYFLLTGSRPFSGDTPTAVSFNIVYTDPPPPSQQAKGLTTGHDHVVGRALAKDPDQRYQTAQEMVQDLEDLRAGQPPRSPAPSPAAGASIDRTSVSRPLMLGPSSTQTLRLPAVKLPRPKRARIGRLALVLMVLIGAAAVWWRYQGLPWDLSRLGAWQDWITVSGSNTGSVEPSQPNQESASNPQTPLPSDPARTTTASPAVIPPSTEPSESRDRTDPRPASTATLRLIGEHNFTSATLVIYIDDAVEPSRTITLRGGPGARTPTPLGSARIDGEVPVPPGVRTISIRLIAPRAGFDQIKPIRADFRAGQTRTLEIGMGRLGRWIGIGSLTRTLTLRWED